jgi:hypothetical protein
MNRTVAENDQAAYIFGQEAEVVLKNKAYTFAITAMKGDIVAKLAINPLLGDNEATIELVRKLQCITEFEDQLEKVMKHGKFAENEITKRNQNKQRNKR